jgi:hypothetical protein
VDSYWLTLHGNASAYDPLLDEVGALRATDESALATSSKGFVLHALWPQDGRLNLIVEGDEHPVELGEFLVERLAPAEWTVSSSELQPSADKAAEAGAGERRSEVVGAVQPELRRCECCQVLGVPPHGPGCVYQRTDEGDAEWRRSRLADLGPTAEPEGVESRETVQA